MAAWRRRRTINSPAPSFDGHQVPTLASTKADAQARQGIAGGDSASWRIPDRRTLLAGLATSGVASLLPGTASAAPLRLAVSGNRLRWGSTNVRLRGISTGDPYAARWWRPTSDYSLISSWRANVVRFGIHPGVWRDRQADAKFYLDRDIKAALAANMWVVVDWHMIGWPGVPPHDPDYDTDFNLAKDFWTYVVATYGGDGRIAFELLNEPNSGNVNNPTTWPELRNISFGWSISCGQGHRTSSYARAIAALTICEPSRITRSRLEHRLHMASLCGTLEGRPERVGSFPGRAR